MTPDPQVLGDFQELVARRLGLHFGADRQDLLREALLQGLREGGHHDSAAYFRQLEAPGAALERLAGALTVGETYFFRQWDQFRALVETVLPLRLKARADERRLRVVSAGCASGEEPYSLAMLLQSRFPELDAWPVELTGVDVNPGALAKAAAGLYSAWSLRETPPDMRERFFKPAGRDFQLDPAVLRAVAFEQRNLAEANADLWRRGSCDIIFCRNMLMYYTPESAATLVRCMAHALAPGGFLFLGYAETLRGITHSLLLCHSHDSFYYQRPTEPPADSGIAAPAQAPMSLGWAGMPDRVPDTGWAASIQQATERIASLAAVAVQPPPSQAPAVECPGTAAWERSMELIRHERYQEALEALPPSPAEGADALLLRAVLLVDLGRYSEAQTACERLLQADALNATAHYVLALCREQSGDGLAASAEDRHAIGLDARFAMPWLHLGLRDRRDGSLAQARHGLEQALHLLPQEAPSRVLLFSGGFGREGLAQLCRSNLRALREAS